MATDTLVSRHAQLSLLRQKAAQLRIDSVLATTEAGSGHPTSCASAADIVAVLFFSVMRFDPHSFRSSANGVFVLSKGHAAPLLYAVWAEAGTFPREKLLALRKLDSDFESHPTPRLPFVQARRPGDSSQWGSRRADRQIRNLRAAHYRRCEVRAAGKE